MDWWGQRNVDMDCLAILLMFDRRRRNTLTIIGGKGFAIIINKIKVSRNYTNIIHDLVQSEAIMNYWIKQGRFSANEQININWDVI